MFREAHARQMKVKLYYTIRELSDYTAEFWALRSLGTLSPMARVSNRRPIPGKRGGSRSPRRAIPGYASTSSAALCPPGIPP